MKYDHFTTTDKLLDLGTEHQCLLTSKSATRCYMPPAGRIQDYL